MTDSKELDSVPFILQDHERRITTLENTMNMIVPKMESVENTVKMGNDEQKRKLDVIDQKLMDEFFKKKSTTQENIWKAVLILLGGGSFLYLAIDKLISSL